MSGPRRMAWTSTRRSSRARRNCSDTVEGESAGGVSKSGRSSEITASVGELSDDAQKSCVHAARRHDAEIACEKVVSGADM